MIADWASAIHRFPNTGRLFGINPAIKTLSILFQYSCFAFFGVTIAVLWCAQFARMMLASTENLFRFGSYSFGIFLDANLKPVLQELTCGLCYLPLL